MASAAFDYLTTPAPLAGQKAPLSTLSDAATSPTAVAPPKPAAPPPQQSNADKLSSGLQAAEAKIAGIPIPKLQTPPMPTVKATNPQQMWGSTAMVMATLGSLMTRRPMVTALNAAAGVMNAYRKGDQAAADTAFKTWEIANKNAVEVADFQMEAYKAALANVERGEKNLVSESDLSVKEALAKATALAHAFSDPIALDTMGQNGVQGLMDLIEGRQINLDNHNSNSTALVDYKDGVQSAMDAASTLTTSPEWTELMKNPQANQAKLAVLAKPVADQWNALNNPDGGGGKVGGYDDKTLNFMADQYLSGDTTVFSNLGWGKSAVALKAALWNKIQDKAQAAGMSGADLSQTKAAYAGSKAYATSAGRRAAAVAIAADAANQMSTLALDLSNKVGRGRFLALNSAELAAKRQAGDPDVAAFDTAVNSFVQAYARAISPSGVGTDSQRQHARDLLSTAQSPDAFKAAIDTMQKEMQYEINAAGTASTAPPMPGAGAASPADAGDGGVVDFSTYFGGQ